MMAILLTHCNRRITALLILCKGSDLRYRRWFVFVCMYVCSFHVLLESLVYILSNEIN